MINNTNKINIRNNNLYKNKNIVGWPIPIYGNDTEILAFLCDYTYENIDLAHSIKTDNNYNEYSYSPLFSEMYNYNFYLKVLNEDNSLSIFDSSSDSNFYIKQMYEIGDKICPNIETLLNLDIDESFFNVIDMFEKIDLIFSNKNNLPKTNNHGILYRNVGYNWATFDIDKKVLDLNFVIFKNFEENLENISNDINNCFLNHSSKRINEIVKKNVNNVFKYGNVFIKLTGSKECDYQAADRIANEIGLFDGERPEGYIWHHVYMGWFIDPMVILANIYKNPWIFFTNFNFLTFLNGFETEIIIEFLKLISAANLYDASLWNSSLNGIMEKIGYKPPTEYINSNLKLWNHKSDYALMQLVFEDIHEFCEPHLGSDDQYSEQIRSQEIVQE